MVVKFFAQTNCACSLTQGNVNVRTGWWPRHVTEQLTRVGVLVWKSKYISFWGLEQQTVNLLWSQSAANKGSVCQLFNYDRAASVPMRCS